MSVSCWILLRMRNVLDNVVEETETHILCSTTFFSRKSCRFLDNVEKYGGGTEATDDIKRRTRFACWITQTTHTHTQNCNCYCFSTATIVSRTRLSVTLYVHCVSRLLPQQQCYKYKTTTELKIFHRLPLSRAKIFFWYIRAPPALEVPQASTKKN